MQTIKGVIITNPGDPGAGIFMEQWTLTGEMTFTHESEFTAFKENIRAAFEYVTGEAVLISTIDEEEEREAQFLRDFKPDPCAGHPCANPHLPCNECDYFKKKEEDRLSQNIAPVNCDNPMWDIIGCPFWHKECTPECLYHKPGPDLRGKAPELI